MTINTSLSVTAESSTSMTFTIAPGQMFYPANITFSATDSGNRPIAFNISIQGDFPSLANRFAFIGSGSSFEDAQWNNFESQVADLCNKHCIESPLLGGHLIPQQFALILGLENLVIVMAVGTVLGAVASLLLRLKWSLRTLVRDLQTAGMVTILLALFSALGDSWLHSLQSQSSVSIVTGCATPATARIVMFVARGRFCK